MIERDRGDLAFLHPLLPAGRRPRRRRNHRRRRRQPFSGFQRRNRGVLHRPLPSPSGRRHPEPVRAPDPHVRHGFLLREHGRAGRKARRHRARRHSAPRLFRKFRHRSHRSRHETRALSHRPRQVHRLLAARSTAALSARSRSPPARPSSAEDSVRWSPASITPQYPDSYRRPAGISPEDHAVACVRGHRE